MCIIRIQYTPSLVNGMCTVRVFNTPIYRLCIIRVRVLVNLAADSPNATAVSCLLEVAPLRLRVQDTGGQLVFLSILELLTAPEGTIYTVVFSLARLQSSFDDTVETTISQLKSIQAFAAGAPVVLVGTRR